MGGVTTYYIGNYFEWTGSTGTMVKYYYAGGQRVAMKKGSVVTWLFGDHLGSTSKTYVNGSTTATEQRYYPWGGTRYGSSPTAFQYTGQRNDSSLGLYFYNARYYDPALGRFVQADTITQDFANPQSLNRYSYTLNNPLKYVDPSGHAAGSWQEDSQTGALARSQTHLIYGTLTDLGEYVRTQPSGNDCGAYAVANAISLRIRQVEGRKIVIPGDRTGEIMSYLGYRVDGLRGDLAAVNGATPPWGIVFTFNNLGVLRDLAGLPDLGTAELKTNGTKEDLIQNIQGDKMTSILFAWDKAGGGGAHWVDVVGYNAEEDMFYLINSQGNTNGAAAPADRVEKRRASELMHLWGQRMGMFSNGHWVEVPWDTNMMITYEPAE